MTPQEAADKFHWIQIAEDGVVEMFLDHHMLSSFRQCEAYFELAMMANIKNKHRNWNLEFGIIWHKMVEIFYQQHMDKDFNLNTWLGYGVELWHLNNMMEFEEHKTCKTMGGVHGFIAMLGQYAQFFAAEVDRLRVIGIEITFGKKKEVPLGSFCPFYKHEGQIPRPAYNVRCYLSGRIDFLMDSGSAIGPLDHKTSTNFGNKNMANEYDPQEGMTGYVFATKKIVEQRFPELLVNRKVDKIWMNFAQLTPEADAMKRFRRIPVYKTDFQLEEWRLRQIRTFHKIYDMIILGERPDWNTVQGCKIYNSDCTYKRLHQQNSSSNMLTILQADFIVGKPWNTEEVEDVTRKTMPSDVGVTNAMSE